MVAVNYKLKGLTLYKTLKIKYSNLEHLLILIYILISIVASVQL